VGTKGSVLWLVLGIAALWGYEDWHSASTISSDFEACNIGANKMADIWERDLSVVTPDRRHEDVEAQLHTCMLGKSYIYEPSAWAKCPNEKIPLCYRSPTIVDLVKSVI
jgi:hypothetical protein